MTPRCDGRHIARMMCRVPRDDCGTSSQSEDFFCFEDLRFLDPGSIPAASTTFFDRFAEDAMDPELIEFAERIEVRPWNRRGSDKTWVVNAQSTFLKFREQVRQARRVGNQTCIVSRRAPQGA